ncbi:hypothetical protein GURKE_01330 [Brevundimonas phage vB_BpoS-Gurke]|uniref:Uncharacterized protein n=1 Tax=Brevundimonas phage vB_BpoS-Gurke TaxID=2948599 RepID=A0A9E7N1J0_9CAUD|nr:hypothetical protein GURKE_01330 [Brevundimonas phage vB_BpoS-Gurke]
MAKTLSGDAVDLLVTFWQARDIIDPFTQKPVQESGYELRSTNDKLELGVVDLEDGDEPYDDLVVAAELVSNRLARTGTNKHGESLMWLTQQGLVEASKLYENLLHDWHHQGVIDIDDPETYLDRA